MTARFRAPRMLKKDPRDRATLGDAALMAQAAVKMAEVIDLPDGTKLTLTEALVVLDQRVGALEAWAARPWWRKLLRRPPAS